MAGTLTLTTLSDGTNSTSATNCIQGSAKAWVNFNGAGGAVIRASYNVSSVTRNSTGNYNVNFTNAFADTNYVCVGFARRDDTPPGFLLGAGTAYTKTTSSMQIGVVFTVNTAMYDSAEINCMFIR